MNVSLRTFEKTSVAGHCITSHADTEIPVSDERSNFGEPSSEQKGRGEMRGVVDHLSRIIFELQLAPKSTWLRTGIEQSKGVSRREAGKGHEYGRGAGIGR